LSAAVPLWIAEARRWSESEREAARRECLQVIAERGDEILYRSTRKGRSAEAFNALAKAVALLAFAPGGVRVFGLHFEARPEEAGDA